MKTRFNNFLGFLLAGAILAFSVVGIAWHNDAHYGICPDTRMAMADCSDGSGIGMVIHHSTFFSGIMQATYGIGMTLLFLMVCSAGLRMMSFSVRQHISFRFRTYFLQSTFLRDDLARGLRKYFSWFSSIHAPLLAR